MSLRRIDARTPERRPSVTLGLRRAVLSILIGMLLAGPAVPSPRHGSGDPAAGYDQAGTWWSGLTDRVGSPTLYVSQAGATTSAVHYDPYGSLRPGSTRATRVGFACELY